jgi:hypothetical protein
MLPNRWSNNVSHQGSAFHEIITLLTLAPHLARPYQVPGTNGNMPVHVNGYVGQYFILCLFPELNILVNSTIVH